MLAAIDFDGYGHLYFSTGLSYTSEISYHGFVDISDIDSQSFVDMIDIFLDYAPRPLDLLYLILPDGIAKGRTRETAQSSVPCTLNINRSDAMLAGIQYLHKTKHVEGIILDINAYNPRLWRFEDYVVPLSKDPGILAQFSTEKLASALGTEVDNRFPYVLEDLKDYDDLIEEAMDLLKDSEVTDVHEDCGPLMLFVEEFCKGKAQELNEVLLSRFGNELSETPQICLFGSGARILAPWLLPQFKQKIVTETATENYLGKSAIFAGLDFHTESY